MSGQTQTDCRVTGGKDDSKASVTQTAPSTPIGPITGGWPTGDGKAEADKLVDNCKTVAANATDLAKKPEAAAKAQAAGLEALKTQMALLISARDALYGQEAASTVCGAENIRGDKSALNIHNDILISLLGDKGIKAMQASATSEKEDVREPATTVTDAVTAIGKAREKVNAAKAKLAGTEAKITAISFGQTKTDADPYRDSAAKAAKWLAGETAPDGYIGVINKSIDAIEKQLPHGKFAVVEAPKTVPLVAKMNKDYNVIDKAAKDIQLTPSAQTAASANPNPAPANGNPTAAPDAAQLAKDVEDKIGATPKPFSEATAAIKAVQENKDPKLAEGLKSTAQTKFDAANKAWYDAQTKQVGVLNTFTDGLKAIQNPPK
ncbi:MAG: hypothetical protein M0D55_14050 [Elusimicrobiota bacterium]|nr:MAG: hypothetical protein M0D55_14050 [Elusimicrobiota bacterium]